MIDFISKVATTVAHAFLDEAEKRNLRDKIYLITEWGSIGDEKAPIIVELGEKDENYIATNAFLQTSKDGVFVRLMKDGKKVEMPEFKDVFRRERL